jgi:hypothetical protein
LPVRSAFAPDLACAKAVAEAVAFGASEIDLNPRLRPSPQRVEMFASGS